MEQQEVTVDLVAKLFVESFNLLAERVHQTAVAKGWWDTERNSDTLSPPRRGSF